jgi:hypothetical protein
VNARVASPTRLHTNPQPHTLCSLLPQSCPWCKQGPTRSIRKRRGCTAIFGQDDGFRSKLAQGGHAEVSAGLTGASMHGRGAAWRHLVRSAGAQPVRAAYGMPLGLRKPKLTAEKAKEHLSR